MQGPQKPKVTVIVLGGTIVSVYDFDQHCSRPALSGQELVNGVPGLAEAYTINLIEYCNIPGTQMTLDDAQRLAQKIREEIADDASAGVVVIQGTDTLEEIAFFIELVTDYEKPIVFTGAMKSANALYNDASGNIHGAVCVAASPESRNRGVLVYMNEQIFSARDVTKANTTRIDSFQSIFGPLGAVNGNQITFWRAPERKPAYAVGELRKRIPIILSYAGMENGVMESCLKHSCDGIVIEGFGLGNVQPILVPSIRKARDLGIPVIIASRCFGGVTYGESDYEGGGAQLGKMGVIFSGHQNGLKARIKLCVLLSAGLPLDGITRSFAE